MSLDNALPNKLVASWDFTSNLILFGETRLGLGLGDLVARLRDFLVPFWVNSKIKMNVPLSY